MKYLLSIYQPDVPEGVALEDAVPEDVDLEQIAKDCAALVDEMKAAGAWVFNGGLRSASSSTVVRVKDGQVLTTDGPYVEGKEHVGGFNIVEAPDLDAALEWGRKTAQATTLPIEVRPFYDEHGPQ